MKLIYLKNSEFLFVNPFIDNDEFKISIIDQNFNNFIIPLLKSNKNTINIFNYEIDYVKHSFLFSILLNNFEYFLFFEVTINNINLNTKNTYNEINKDISLNKISTNYLIQKLNFKINYKNIFSNFNRKIKKLIYHKNDYFFYSLIIPNLLTIIKFNLNTKSFNLKNYKYSGFFIEKCLFLSNEEDFTGDNLEILCKVYYDKNDKNLVNFHKICLPNLENEIILDHQSLAFKVRENGINKFSRLNYKNNNLFYFCSNKNLIFFNNNYSIFSEIDLLNDDVNNFDYFKLFPIENDYFLILINNNNLIKICKLNEDLKGFKIISQIRIENEYLIKYFKIVNLDKKVFLITHDYYSLNINKFFPKFDSFDLKKKINCDNKTFFDKFKIKESFIDLHEVIIYDINLQILSNNKKEIKIQKINQIHSELSISLDYIIEIELSINNNSDVFIDKLKSEFYKDLEIFDDLKYSDYNSFDDIIWLFNQKFNETLIFNFHNNKITKFILSLDFLELYADNIKDIKLTKSFIYVITLDGFIYINKYKFINESLKCDLINILDISDFYIKENKLIFHEKEDQIKIIITDMNQIKINTILEIYLDQLLIKIIYQNYFYDDLILNKNTINKENKSNSILSYYNKNINLIKKFNSDNHIGIYVKENFINNSIFYLFNLNHLFNPILEINFNSDLLDFELDNHFDNYNNFILLFILVKDGNIIILKLDENNNLSQNDLNNCDFIKFNKNNLEKSKYKITNKSLLNYSSLVTNIKILSKLRILILFSNYGNIKFLDYDEFCQVKEFYEFNYSSHLIEVSNIKNNYENREDLLKIFEEDISLEFLETYIFFDSIIFDKIKVKNMKENHIQLKEKFIILIKNFGLLIFIYKKDEFTGYKQIKFFQQLTFNKIIKKEDSLKIKQICEIIYIKSNIENYTIIFENNKFTFL